MVVDALYLSWLWPDWDRLARGPVPKSSFILTFESEQQEQPHPLRLQWHPIPSGQMPPWLRRAVVVAEDSRFYTHNGIDLDAMWEAFSYNWERGKVVYGASTISQQTAKNLFLTRSRNPLRKWHELVLTWAMEAHLSKRRILELYLNVAEFGPGIYGVDAAARHYWQEGASDLTFEQAVELAATLPSPKNDNPTTRTRAFLQRRDKILRNLEQVTRRDPPIRLVFPSAAV